MDNWSGPQAKAYKCIAGIALPPLQTRTAGPADKLKKQDDDDVLDEALAYIRNDSLVRRWVVDGAGCHGFVFVIVKRCKGNTSLKS